MGKNKGKKKANKAPAVDNLEETIDSGPPTDEKPPLAPVLRIAKAPFNRPGGDTVSILTSDGTTFFVNGGILSLASKKFKDEISRRDLEVNASEETIYCPCRSYVFDIILRFLYPMKSPVFKDMSECDSMMTIPYCMMESIYEDAQVLGMDYVCSLIVDCAKEIVTSQMVPRSGDVATRIYALACAFGLSYEYRLKAARSFLYVYMESELDEALRSMRIQEHDVLSLKDYHRRAFEAVYDLLRINAEDAFPEGLPDIYASCVSCAQCCEAEMANRNPMRPGAALWWQDYVNRALEVQRYAPFSQIVFTADFILESLKKAKGCLLCSQVVHWKWGQMFLC